MRARSSPAPGVRVKVPDEQRWRLLFEAATNERSSCARIIGVRRVRQTFYMHARGRARSRDRFDQRVKSRNRAFHAHVDDPRVEAEHAGGDAGHVQIGLDRVQFAWSTVQLHHRDVRTVSVRRDAERRRTGAIVGIERQRGGCC